MKSLRLYAPKSIKPSLIRALLLIEIVVFIAIACALLRPEQPMSVEQAIRQLSATDSPFQNQIIDLWNKIGIAPVTRKPTGAELQRQAVLVLIRYGPEASPAAPHLAARLRRGVRPDVDAALGALIAIGTNSIPHVLPVLTDTNAYSRSAAVYTLAKIRPFTLQSAVALEDVLVKDSNPLNRRIAARGLIEAVKSIPSVLDRLPHRWLLESDDEITILIGCALVNAGKFEAAIPMLVNHIHQVGPDYKYWLSRWRSPRLSSGLVDYDLFELALEAFSRIPDDARVTMTLKSLAMTPVGPLRLEVTKVLWRKTHNAEAVIPSLFQVMKFGQPVGEHALDFMAEMGPSAIAATDTLVARIKERDDLWAHLARRTLQKINPEVEASLPPELGAPPPRERLMVLSLW